MAIGIILERARKQIADEADHLIGSIIFLFIFIGYLQSSGSSKRIWTHGSRKARQDSAVRIRAGFRSGQYDRLLQLLYRVIGKLPFTIVQIILRCGNEIAVLVPGQCDPDDVLLLRIVDAFYFTPFLVHNIEVNAVAFIIFVWRVSDISLSVCQGEIECDLLVRKACRIIGDLLGCFIPNAVNINWLEYEGKLTLRHITPLEDFYYRDIDRNRILISICEADDLVLLH